MKKPSKKQMIYLGIVGLVLLLLWLWAKKKSSTVINGAGKPADTSYLTFNIPPINGDGFTVPTFGNINIPGITLPGGSGCSNCQFSSYYGSPNQLAANLGSSGADAVAEALAQATGGMNANVSIGVSNTGSFYEQPYKTTVSFNGSAPAPVDNSQAAPPANAVISHLPIMAY